jgi:hypothetical protein
VEESSWERYGLAAGIVFVVLVVIAALIGGSPPKPTDSAAKVFSFFRDNQDALKVGSYLNGLAAVAFLWFLGSIWARMRRAEGTGSRVSVVALVGGVGALGMAFVGNAVSAYLALYVGLLGPSTKSLYQLAVVFLAFASFFLAVFTSATSVTILRYGFVERWMGWAGEVIAVLWLIAGIGVADDNTTIFTVGFVAFLLWAIWLLVLSVLLLTRDTAAATRG